MGVKYTDIDLSKYDHINLYFSGSPLYAYAFKDIRKYQIHTYLWSVIISKSILSNLYCKYIYLRFLFFFLNELAFSDFFSHWYDLTLKNQL